MKCSLLIPSFITNLWSWRPIMLFRIKWWSWRSRREIMSYLSAPPVRNEEWRRSYVEQRRTKRAGAAAQTQQVLAKEQSILNECLEKGWISDNK